MDNNIKLINVCKNYSTKIETVNALAKVSLTLPNSGIVFILGKSGCGKTTLLNMLGGLDSPNSGEILVGDIDISKMSLQELNIYRNYNVGFVFQDYHLISNSTVSQNIALALRLQGNEKTHSRVLEVLEKVDLVGYEKRKITELSGGQMQRVGIARALAKDSKFILADEPTGNLDSKTGKEIFGLLKNISKDKLVIIVSHDKDNAYAYGDRVVEMVDGRIDKDVLVSNIYQESEDNITSVVSGVVEAKECVVKSDDRADHSQSIKGQSSKKHSCSLGAIMTTNYALKSMTRRPLRMVATIIMMCIALVVFGLSVSQMNYNPNRVAYQAYSDYNSSVTIIHNPIDKDSGSDKIALRDKTISTSDMDKFSEVYGEEMFPIYAGVDHGFTVMDSDAMSQQGLTMLLGELPTSKNQVALPDILAEKFILEDETVATYEELLGKSKIKLSGYDAEFILTGIVDTGMLDIRAEFAEKVAKDLGEEFDKDYYEREFANMFLQDSIYNAYYVVDEFIDHYYPYPSSTNQVSLRGYQSGDTDIYNGNMIPLSTARNTSSITMLDGGDVNLGQEDVLFSRDLLVKYLKIDVSSESTDEELIKIIEDLDLGSVYFGSDYFNAYTIKGFYNGDKNGLYSVENISEGIVFADRVAYENMNISSSIQSVGFSMNVGDGNTKELLEYLSENDFIIQSPLEGDLQVAHDKAETLIEMWGWITLVSGVVACLLMINYLGAAISVSRSEIGMLRAFGVSNVNIVALYLIEALAVALVALVIAISLVFPIAMIPTFNVTVLLSKTVIIGVGEVFAMIGLALGVTLLCSLIPILVNAKKTPVELLSDVK